jgi:hypothetical protein
VGGGDPAPPDCATSNAYLWQIDWKSNW